MKELPLAEAPVKATAEAEHPAPEAKTEKAPPPKGARFASMHTLVMRVDALGDLVSGACFVRNKDGLLQPFTTDKIPSEKLLGLLEEGRVYTPWGHRYLEFDELTPAWAEQTRRPEPDAA